MDENSQSQITQIAVAPAGTGRMLGPDGLDHLEKLILCIILAQVEILRVVGEPCGVAQQLGNGDLKILTLIDPSIHEMRYDFLAIIHV
jgi:hypothetical protein